MNGDILEFYAHCLEKLKISVVGPVLRTDDLPDCYALKQNVIKHENKFLKREHKTIEWKGKEYDFIVAPIDTTFGLYSSKFKFKRHQEGIRLFDPYSARHLD